MLTITLCRPDRLNAQTPTMWLALAELADTLPEQVRVVVIRAEGRSFSAGLDRAMFASPPAVDGEPDIVGETFGDPQRAADLIGQLQQGFARWREVTAIVVAAVQGHAIGAGFQLALAADLRVVADDVQFAMREVTLGLVPDLGGTATLVPLVGYSRALELCATGRALGAAEAVAWGLATVAVPPAELDAATDDLVAAVLAAPEPTLRSVKSVLVQAISSPYAAQLRHERTAQVPLLQALARRAAGATRHTGGGDRPGQEGPTR